jgi:phosphoribosylglycinamide formyltransferase-1
MSAVKPRIAFLASGRGSNFEALMAAVREGRVQAEPVALVCDRFDAPVVEKARALGLPVALVPAPPVSSGTLKERREAHGRTILEALAPHRPDWLVLAGFMRILPSSVMAAFRDPRGFNRVVNVHPSLLPAFPGRDSYRQAFEHGCQLAGVTVHLVEPEVDSGPILAQEAFPIAAAHDAGEVEALGLAVEHRLYPATLSWLLSGNFQTFQSESSRRLRVRQN